MGVPLWGFCVRERERGGREDERGILQREREKRKGERERERKRIGKGDAI
jgi:hypothetical protein